MKILAADYGASRTGLAVCDPTEFLTTPGGQKLLYQLPLVVAVG